MPDPGDENRSTLAESVRIKAERDRYREALERILQTDSSGYFGKLSREALEGKNA